MPHLLSNSNGVLISVHRPSLGNQGGGGGAWVELPSSDRLIRPWVLR